MKHYSAATRDGRGDVLVVQPTSIIAGRLRATQVIASAPILSATSPM